jgi:transcriptional regulator with XRE-family HTH domain
MAEDIKLKLGRKIRETRVKEGYSQEELASRCGLHRTYISDIERGERNVSVENIEKIAKALKTEPDELFRF